MYARGTVARQPKGRVYGVKGGQGMGLGYKRDAKGNDISSLWSNPADAYSPQIETLRAECVFTMFRGAKAMKEQILGARR